jgi:hypothetical protein
LLFLQEVGSLILYGNLNIDSWFGCDEIGFTAVETRRTRGWYHNDHSDRAIR